MKIESKAQYEIRRAKFSKGIEAFLTTGATAHFHHDIELMLVSDGKIDTKIKGVFKKMERGDISVADSFDIHEYYPLSKEAVGHIIILPKNLIPEYTAMVKKQVLSENFISDNKVFNFLEPLFLQLENNISENNQLYNKGISLAIMSVIIKNMPFKTRTESDKDYVMREVLNYIHDNYDQKLTLNILAKKFAFSPNHFSHLFNSFAQTNLSEYINTVRAEQSAALLKEGASVNTAAFDSGFESIRTFYRYFSLRYNMTPQQYIKQL